MNLLTIRNFPTMLSAEDMKVFTEGGSTGVHESVLRAYQILEKVKWLIDEGTPIKAIRELIELMEGKD